MSLRITTSLCRLKSVKLTFCLIACLGIGVLAGGARRWAGPQNNPKDDPLIVEEFTLRPTGFYPARLTRSKGKFLLVVNNRTGLEEIDIAISREVGNGPREKLKDVKVHRKLLDWNDVFDLNPGTYVVTEASNPKWVCRISVTPN
jgi:hypothetical protein